MGAEAIPKTVRLSVVPIPLTQLSCLVSVGEETPSPAETWYARVGGYQEGTATLSKKGREMVGEAVEGGTEIRMKSEIFRWMEGWTDRQIDRLTDWLRLIYFRLVLKSLYSWIGPDHQIFQHLGSWDCRCMPPDPIYIMQGIKPRLSCMGPYQLSYIPRPKDTTD